VRRRGGRVGVSAGVRGEPVSGMGRHDGLAWGFSDLKLFGETRRILGRWTTNTSRSALARPPTASRYFCMRSGLAQVRAGNYEEGIDHLRASARLSPLYPDAHHNLARE